MGIAVLRSQGAQQRQLYTASDSSYGPLAVPRDKLTDGTARQTD